jgi:hypothetical protein
MASESKNHPSGLCMKDRMPMANALLFWTRANPLNCRKTSGIAYEMPVFDDVQKRSPGEPQ